MAIEKARAHLAALGLDVHVFSVDRSKDLRWTAEEPSCLGLKIHGLYPDWLPYNRALLVLLMPLLLLSKYFVGRQMDILKTNQGHSGIHVLLAAVLWHRPYVSRSGYVLSEQLENRKDKSRKDRLLAVLERIVMRRAVCCFVPTQYHVDWCREHICCQRLELMPNNVDGSICNKVLLNLEFLTVTVPEQTLIALLLVADELMNVEFSIIPLPLTHSIAPE